jgi:hypothetical protein
MVLPFVMRVDMTDEQEGLVVLFPENFPDWALSPEERRAKRKLRLVESGDGEHDPADDDRD